MALVMNLLIVSQQLNFQMMKQVTVPWRSVTTTHQGPCLRFQQSHFSHTCLTPTSL